MSRFVPLGRRDICRDKSDTLWVSDCPGKCRLSRPGVPPRKCETMLITLTTIDKDGGYDDQITINVDMIRTIRLVAIGDDPDSAIICTEIDLGVIVSEDDGQIVSKPIYVSEPPNDIVVMVRARSR